MSSDQTISQKNVKEFPHKAEIQAENAIKTISYKARILWSMLLLDGKVTMKSLSGHRPCHTQCIYTIIPPGDIMAYVQLKFIQSQRAIYT